jgi:hypothetical protein
MKARGGWLAVSCVPLVLVVQGLSGRAVPLDQWITKPSGVVKLHW